VGVGVRRAWALPERVERLAGVVGQGAQALQVGQRPSAAIGARCHTATLSAVYRLPS
jgi:hypothetical protein